MRHRQHIRACLSERKPLVVGAIADRQTLATLPSGCDVVELRIDSLGTGPDVVRFAKESPLPLLITARGAAEGGQSDWNIGERAAAYETLMPLASLIDIELRDFDSFQPILDLAQEHDVTVVGSYHNFDKTPPEEELFSHFDDRPDVHKFALMAKSPADIRTHLRLLENTHSRLLSVMGMGPLGAAARPLMAKAGSLLNYGFLGSVPTAPDQWPASLLRDAMAV